jgi:hypothetical protein
MHGYDRLDSLDVVATRTFLSSVCEGIVGGRDDSNKSHATKRSIRGVNVRQARSGVKSADNGARIRVQRADRR